MRRRLERCLQALDKLSPLCGIPSSPLGEMLRALLEELAQLAGGETLPGAPQRAWRCWQGLQAIWLKEEVTRGRRGAFDLPQILLGALLEDEHLFLKQSEGRPFVQLHPELVGLMRADLRALQQLAGVPLPEWVAQLTGEEIAPSQELPAPLVPTAGAWPWEQVAGEREELKRRFDL